MYKILSVSSLVVTFLFIGIFLPITQPISFFKDKTYKIEKAGSCNNESKIEVLSYTLRQPKRGTIYLNTRFNVREDIVGKLELRYNSSKCTVDSNRCELLDARIFNDNICQKMNENNPFWTPAIQSFRPPLKCPISKGIYSIVNATFDTAMTAMLPLEGYRWISYQQIYEMPTHKNDKYTELLCITSTTLVTASRSRKQPH